MATENNQTTSLEDRIRELGPWHHNLQITDDLSTGQVFGSAEDLKPAQNNNVSLISKKDVFVKHAGQLYPDGMRGKRFLNCACNAGAFCFFARELDAEFSFGFDVRKHWIDQAMFVKANRTVSPTDRIEFQQLDLKDLPNQDLEPFDFTIFSGIFYHLPDPIAGLKNVADLTSDVLILNTAGMAKADEPLGLTMIREPVEAVMSGVHNLAWMPNSPQVLVEILSWLGFHEFKLTRDVINDAQRRRIEIVAAREPGRLADHKGKNLHSRVFRDRKTTEDQPTAE